GVAVSRQGNPGQRSWSQWAAGRLYPASVLRVSGEGKLKVHARLRLPQSHTSGSNFNQAADPCAPHLNCDGDKQGFAKRGVKKMFRHMFPFLMRPDLEFAL